MKTDLPPLNWLKTFEAAARLLNFSAAGRELHLTQSAVSQQIGALEHQLGEPLFHRSAQRVSLTDSGRAYLPVVQDAIGALQRSTSEIFSPAGKGQLVLKVNITFATLWLTPRLQRFCAQYPELTVQMVHANWESEFINSVADLTILHGRGQWSGVRAQPLFAPQLKPYCAPELARTLREPGDLLAVPLVEIIGNRQGWQDWFASAGVDNAGARPLRHKVDSLALAVPMAEAGLGAFLSYEGLIANPHKARNLQPPFDLGVATEENYYLTCPEGRPLSKSAALFCAWLFEELGLPRERLSAGFRDS